MVQGTHQKMTGENRRRCIADPASRPKLRSQTFPKLVLALFDMVTGYDISKTLNSVL
jgi:hypothetical protein